MKTRTRPQSLLLGLALITSFSGIFAQAKAEKKKSPNPVEAQAGEREPASVIESKKNIANQGVTEPVEEPTRLWNSEWRKSAAHSGFDFQAFYLWDGINNVNGGLKKGGVGISTLDVMLNFDFEKMWQWNGLSAYVQYHTNHKSHPEEYVGGDANVFGGYTVNDSLISQAYLKYNNADSDWSALFGLYDFATEFFFNDSSFIFLNPRFTTLVGSSIEDQGISLSEYPVNGPGFRFKKIWNKEYYVMAGLATAQARDSKFEMGTHPVWTKDTGSYQFLEIGMQPEISKDAKNKYLVGAWNVTKAFEELENPAQETHPSGVYLMTDHHINEDVTAFFNISMANSKVSAEDQSWALGIHYSKIFNEKDLISLAYTSTKLAKSELHANSTLLVEKENVFELLYRIEVVPGLAIMPDLQYIQNPSMTKDIDSATVTSLHIEMSI